MNEIELKNAAKAIEAEVKSTLADTELTAAQKSERLDKIETESTRIGTELKNLSRGRALMTGADVAEEDAPETKAFQPRNIGEAVIADGAYEAAVKAAKTGSRFSFNANIGAKAQGATSMLGENATGTTAGAAIGSNYFLGGNAGPTILPNFLPGIVEQRFYPLTLADLFAAGSTDAPIISYVKETAWTNNAAAVGEGTTKPYSTDTVARVQEQVGKVANLHKITDEMLQDAPAFASFLQGRLIFGVQRQEEVQLLSGTGYPGVAGLLPRFAGFQKGVVGTGTVANATNSVVGRKVINTGAVTDAAALADGFFSAMTDIRFNAFVEPDAIILNPIDWQTIRLAKDAQGQYLGGSFFGADYGQPQNAGHSLWGLRVVVTPAVIQGQAIIGGFREAAQLFRRQGITVEMTNSNGTDFEQNLVTVRAESRLALAVYRPGAFEVINITAS
jgi:HK97 family phage major capsid protein